MATVAGSLRNKVLVVDDLTSGDITVTDLVVSGTVTLQGTATTLDSTNTTVTDSIIELNSGLTGANANDIGLILERGSTGNNVFIGWDESADKVVAGLTTATGSSTGNLTLTYANFQAANATFTGTVTTTGLTTTGTVTASGGNSTNWNTAYGWGNHASAGYLTSHQSLSAYLLNTTDTFAGNLTFIGGNNTSKESFINVKRGDASGLWLKFQTDSTSANNVSQFVIRRSTDSVDILNLTATNGNIAFVGTVTAPNINTGQGANELYAMNQNVRTTDSPTFDELTVTDFVKATGNNLKFSAGGTHILNIDVNGKIYPNTHNAYDIGFSSTTAFRNAHFSGVGNFGTINTGQGATEVHLMNQNIRTTDSVTFAGLTTTGNIVAEDSEVHVGDVSGDNWTRIKHAQADGYGFDFQHDNATVIVNEQGSTNQVMVLGDVDAANYSGLFGVAHTTNSGTAWTKKLDLRGNGELYIGASGTNQVYHEGHKPTYSELGTMAYSNLTGTPTIPTNNNQLTNGAGYITDGNTNWNNSYGFITASDSSITNKLPLAGGTMTGALNMNSNAIQNANLTGASTYFPGHAYSNTHDGTNVYWHIGSAAGSTNKVLNLRIYNSSNSYILNQWSTTGLSVAGTITSSGDGFFNGTKLEGDSKEMIRYNDAWLRLNPANEFTSGIYCGTGILRTDGNFQVGSSGSAFSVTTAGNVSLSGTLDGRDVAADGTKLDTIATNADVTPSWVPSSNPGYATGSFLPLSGGTMTGDITIPSKIIHSGDTDTYIQFHAGNQFRVVAGGVEVTEWRADRMQMSNKAITFGNWDNFSETALSGFGYAALNAPIHIPAINIGTTNKYLPFLQGSAQHTSGYRTSYVFGAYKRAVLDNGTTQASWGDGHSGFFMGMGDSDAAPTTEFRFSWDGKIWHSGSGSGSTYIDYGDANVLKFVANSTQRMEITAGGTTFNDNVSIGGNQLENIGNAYFNEYLYHNGDTDTYIRIQDNSWTFRTGGGDRLVIDNTNLTVNANLDLKAESDTGANSIHLPRGGHLSLYGNGSLDHSISSRNSAITATDDIRISSYGAVYINLDSNSNNTSTADFVIARHNTTPNLFKVDGETGAGYGMHSYPNAGADGVSLSSYAQGTVPINQGVVQIRSVGKTGWANGDELGSIDWYNSDGSGVGARNLARIVAVNSQGNGSSTTTFNGELHFYTSAYNAQLNAAPVMRLTENNSVIIGDGTDASSCLQLRPADDGFSDDIQFYNGSTRMGEIGTQDTTWLRINQSTSKNIYTPRYIRADGGFFVDGTAKGINGSGNFFGGTITGASDANVSNWDTAYGWGNHASAGYITGNQTITLTGDVSGSGTTSISVTIADDSHNHVISNVDGLQTALDAKMPLSGGTFTGNVTISQSGTPILTLYDNGNAGGGGAAGKILFSNTGGNAMGIGYTGDSTADSDMIISTNAAGTYGGRLSLAAAAITDSSADIILEPKGSVRIAGSGNLQMGTTTVINSSGNWVGGGNISEFTNDSSYITASNSAITNKLPLAGGTMSGALNMANQQIYGINNLRFNDAGVNEGIKWDGGSEWQIYESPDDQTNAAGNLQFTTGTGNGTRRFSITTAGYIGATRTYFAVDRSTGYFYNDSGSRTAYTGGDFYIKADVGNCYIYATNTFLGASSGDTIKFRANTVTADAWGITPGGDITISDKVIHNGDTDTYMSFDSADQWKLYCGGQKMIQATEASSGYDYVSFGGTTNSGLVMFNLSSGDGHFDGDIYAFSTTTSSDRKLKKNIQPLEGALEKVQNLRGVSFEWKKNNKKSIGFIAQEVQEVVPDLVKNNRKEHDGKLIEEHLGIDYGNITALLVEAVKEQQSLINRLEGRIKDLENKNGE